MTYLNSDIVIILFSEMATAIPTEGDKEDNHLLELKRVREKIKAKFAELADCLKARENQLLLDLDNVIASYLSFQVELETVNEKRGDLETTKVFLENQLLASQTNKAIHLYLISQLTTELTGIKSPIEPKMVSFECDSNQMSAELNKLAKLVEKVRIGIDYKRKKLSLVSVCERGRGIGQRCNPIGMTVDNTTGNIYVADLDNHCVKVFDSNGKYLFQFNDSKGGYPRGIAIYGDRVVVTQSTNCVLNYRLNGVFISRIGRQGRGELDFDWPLGLTIDESNGDIYICDSNNDRVQILNRDFSFKAQFGKDELIHPRDVKLLKEYIYILDESNLCLHLFNYNYILQKSVITRGKRMDIVNSYFFFIDETNNILVTDYKSNCINIYNAQFQLIHKISVSPCPMGIAVDLKGRVIVVCQSKKIVFKFSNCRYLFLFSQTLSSFFFLPQILYSYVLVSWALLVHVCMFHVSLFASCFI